MAVLTNRSITDAGRILLSDVQAGAVLIPTKLVMGSGNMPTGKTAASMTSVVSPVLEFPVTKQERTPDGKAIFGGVYMNTSITNAFYYREIALFARAEYRNANGDVVKSVDECLYAYGNFGSNADLLPAYSSGTIVERKIDLVVWVGGTNTTIELTIENGSYVTPDQLERALQDIDFAITDDTTKKRYVWGIDNGMVYLKEVV